MVRAKKAKRKAGGGRTARPRIRKSNKKAKDGSADTGASTSGRQALPFNKAFGQHILSNPGVIDNIVEKAAIKSTDTVLEVGPGTGNLTVKLLARAKKVVACEIDARLVAELTKRVIGSPLQSKLEIVPGDVLKSVDGVQFDICVANLPFQISSPFVFKLIMHRPFIRCAVVMFQKEFADRLTAQPGDKHYCRLSANVQLLANVEHLIKVGRKSFRPPPEVDAAVVRIEPVRPAPPIDYVEWDNLLRIAFHRKNKTLAAALGKRKTMQTLHARYNKHCSVMGLEPLDYDGVKAAVRGVLERSAFAKRRARRLHVDDFLALLFEFNKAGIRFV